MMGSQQQPQRAAPILCMAKCPPLPPHTEYKNNNNFFLYSPFFVFIFERNWKKKYLNVCLFVQRRIRGGGERREREDTKFPQKSERTFSSLFMERCFSMGAQNFRGSDRVSFTWHASETFQTRNTDARSSAPCGRKDEAENPEEGREEGGVGIFWKSKKGTFSPYLGALSLLPRFPFLRDVK